MEVKGKQVMVYVLMREQKGSPMGQGTNNDALKRNVSIAKVPIWSINVGLSKNIIIIQPISHDI